MANAQSKKPRRGASRAAASQSAKRHGRTHEHRRHRGAEPLWAASGWPVLILTEVLEFIRLANPRAARLLAAVLAMVIATAAWASVTWLLLGVFHL
jgi:hypothetical protein